MFKITAKNLINQFRKQKLLSLLLVLNIVVSCLVICFSYGLYHNYRAVIAKGEKEDVKTISVLAGDTDFHTLDNAEGMEVGTLAPSQLSALMYAFSENTLENVDGISFNYIVKTPLYFNDTDLHGETPMYDENAEPYYNILSCSIALENGRIVDNKDSVISVFSDEEYFSGEKIVALSERYFQDGEVIGYNFGKTSASACKLPKNAEAIIINGESYRISKVLDEKTYGSGYDMEIPYAVIPESTQVLYRSYSEHQRTCFRIDFKQPLTNRQRDDISECIKQTLGESFYLEDIRFTDVTDLGYYSSIIAVSLLIAAVSAINISILYSFLLEKRSRDLAVLRICGLSKGKAVMSYLLECIIINAPLFLATEIIFAKLLVPLLARFFPMIRLAYNIKLYTAIFFIYLFALCGIMLVALFVKLHFHSIAQARSAPRSSAKTGFMQVFGVLQLAAVLVMLIFVVSAISSRSVQFDNFKEYISRKGYMIKNMDMSVFPEELSEVANGAETIFNCYTNIYEDSFDKNLANSMEHNMIIYSDEFVNAYAPPLNDGVWLDETDDTFENSGYIPTVTAGGDIHVGDIIESTVIMSIDENGLPDKTISAKYKVIGVVKDNVPLAVYSIDSSFSASYKDIYSTFRSSYEDKMLLLTRTSDMYACYKSFGPLYGTQFIFCDGMTDEEYIALGDNLENMPLSFAPLSQVYENSTDYVYQQLYTLLPIAVCIFILTIISTVSVSAIYTKRQLRNYAIFYICGARWRICALRSLKNSAITCGIASILAAAVLIVGKLTFFKETVISFGWWHLAVCAGVIVLYLSLSMIMPLMIIGSNEPKEVLKEE